MANVKILFIVEIDGEIFAEHTIEYHTEKSVWLDL